VTDKKVIGKGAGHCLAFVIPSFPSVIPFKNGIQAYFYEGKALFQSLTYLENCDIKN